MNATNPPRGIVETESGSDRLAVEAKDAKEAVLVANRLLPREEWKVVGQVYQWGDNIRESFKCVK